MEDGPHATTHSLTGGIYGCDLLTPMLEAGYISDEKSQKEICSKWVFYMKEFYRYNFLTPKSDCVVEDTLEESTCGYECSTDAYEPMVLNLKNKINNFVSSQMQESSSNPGWTAWKDFICTGNGHKMFSGDHLESASPADPSFWVIHPTLERLLHVKLMAGGFEDETWASDSENDYVCNKAQCYESKYDSYGYYDECCDGHYEDSQLLDPIAGDRYSYTGPTNGETLAATDPRSSSYSVPYIYQHFSWSHCSNDFDGLIQDMYDAADDNDGTTAKPTHKPSHSPTHKPSYSPTESPDSSSTAKPTHKPSHSPTESPNSSSTAKPTHKPTHSPTDSPSSADESDDTAKPTKKPTQPPEYWDTHTRKPTTESR
jgi:hypothetical protein